MRPTRASRRSDPAGRRPTSLRWRAGRARGCTHRPRRAPGPRASRSRTAAAPLRSRLWSRSTSGRTPRASPGASASTHTPSAHRSATPRREWPRSPRRLESAKPPAAIGSPATHPGVGRSAVPFSGATGDGAPRSCGLGPPTGARNPLGLQSQHQPPWRSSLAVWPTGHLISRCRPSPRARASAAPTGMRPPRWRWCRRATPPAAQPSSLARPAAADA